MTDDGNAILAEIDANIRDDHGTVTKDSLLAELEKARRDLEGIDADTVASVFADGLMAGKVWMTQQQTDCVGTLIALAVYIGIRVGARLGKDDEPLNHGAVFDVASALANGALDSFVAGYTYFERDDAVLAAAGIAYDDAPPAS